MQRNNFFMVRPSQRESRAKAQATSARPFCENRLKTGFGEFRFLGFLGGEDDGDPAIFVEHPFLLPFTACVSEVVKRYLLGRFPLTVQ